jgi:methionyl-tRNA formyltransferase
MLRIVFMGSPAFAVPSLTYLVNNGFDVVAVCTQPDRPSGRGRAVIFPPVKEAALQMGLPVLQPPDVGTPDSLVELADYKPDVIVICAFGQILPQSVLDIPPHQCVNLHFSLLPRHRGASPVAAAILAGDAFTGVSIQLVRKKLDTGPVLAAAAVPVMDADNTGTLTDKLAVMGAWLLNEALTGWVRGEITPRPQDEAAASYFGQIKKEDGEIDWRQPAANIWRQVRAYYPWPGCYTTWKGKKLKITSAAVLPDKPSTGAGRVVALSGSDEVLGVGTGDGVLGVLRLQLEGRRAMSAPEFLHGQRDFIGSVLPC